MIITNISGGLGNQMFQYATGRALSLMHGVPLLLDIRDFLQYSMHQGFELKHVFSAPVELASPDDLYKTLGWQSSRLALRLLAHPKMRLLRTNRLVIEPHFQYFSGIKQVPSSCYLKGYWQSERYFTDMADVIRDDFRFHPPLSNENSHIAKNMREVNAVSLHVRRGDYISNRNTLAVHGVCSLEYYTQAIRHIVERTTDPVFFVFSDDIEWVKNNLQIAHPCYLIDHNNGIESYNDMRLMSLCKHNIIANSSFSWWGAWLNSHADKIVIAPARWFVSDTYDSADLVPADWVRL